MPKATMAELGQHKADLERELAEVNEEIAARAGEVDPEPDDKPAKKTTAK